MSRHENVYAMQYPAFFLQEIGFLFVQSKHLSLSSKSIL